MVGKQAKEFLLFRGFFPYNSPLYYSVFLFHAPSFKGIIKQKTKIMTFFDHGVYVSQNIFAFL